MTEFELNEFSLFSNQTLVFQQNIIEYITTEIDKIPEGRTILATSDIIESIFGKYKHFSSRCPLKQIGQMILSISLCTMNLTTSVVKQALEDIRYIDLKDWASRVFGQSMLSKRKIVFSTSVDDIEFA